MTIYMKTARQLKALSDPKRLRIVDMLSAGELCACEILEGFEVCQSTLSHDMKVLVTIPILIQRERIIWRLSGNLFANPSVVLCTNRI